MKPDASAGLKDETNVVKNCGAAGRRPAAMLYSAATGCGCSLTSLSLDSSSLAERNSGSGSASEAGLTGRGHKVVRLIGSGVTRASNCYTSSLIALSRILKA